MSTEQLIKTYKHIKMKTSKHTFLLLSLCLLISWQGYGQQTVVEYDSGAGDPQLLLKEVGAGASFSRLTFQNQSPGFWTFAARTGAGTNDDDFNLFYDNGTDAGFNIINIEADADVINLVSNVDVGEELNVRELATVHDLSVDQEASFTRGLLSSEPLKVRDSGQGPSGGEIQFMQDNSFTNSAARIRLTNATGGGNNRNWLFVHDSAVGFIDFETDGSSILRMNNDNVGINETIPTANLHIKQTGSGEEGLAIENDTDSDTWAFEIGANDLNLTFNGTFAGSWNDTDGVYAPSDITLKNTISALESGTLDKVMKLQPSSYYYNSAQSEDRKSYGFIAQEVQKIYPDLVKEIDSGDPKDDGLLSMNYGKLIPVLTKAMQEQQAIIEDLQKEVASL